MPDYLDLVAAQHRKPRFLALLAALTDPVREIQTLLASAAGTFDLDTALGVQLDATGAWIGRTRHLPVPLEGVFFSWSSSDADADADADDEARGWNDAPWRGKYDAATTMLRLPDAPFRTLLRAKVAANRWDGTIPDAYAAWDAAFAGTGGIILMQDNGDMSMTLALLGLEPDATTRALLTSGYLPLKPEGVRITGLVLPPPRKPEFGFDQYDTSIKGVDEGYWRDGERREIDPLFAWGCESDFLCGWGRGVWGTTCPPGGIRGGAADKSRWWGGRRTGDGVLRREAFSWSGSATQGWAQGAWQ